MSAPPSPLRVLVVDDDASIRLVVRTAFDDAEVLEAADGREALALLEREPVDVVLLDVMMPGVDGYSVLEALRASDFHALVPVLLVTARNTAVDRVRAWRGGADGFITKPFDVDDLVDRVRQVVARSGAERVAIRAEELARAGLRHAADARR